MLRQIFKSFGLNEKEIALMLKMLELGPQPASTIARICERPRNSVRSMLDVLAERGLVLKTMRANTQYYAVDSKDNLIRALTFKKQKTAREIDEQIRLLEEYGHEFTDRKWAASRPRIRYYEGWTGLQKVYEDTLTTDCLKSWASFDALMEDRPEYFLSYFKRRAAAGIPIRSIHPDVPHARAAQKRDVEEMRESALVPVERFRWGPEIQVYGDKVNIVSWTEKLGIIIESREIAEAMRAIFDLSYEAAGSYGKVTKLPKDMRKAFDQRPSRSASTGSGPGSSKASA